MPPGRALLYVATFAALLLVGRSLVLGPIPLPYALLAIGAYLAVVLAGVLSLRLRMFVDAICEGPPEARGVALTFDDGPHPVHTAHVLDLLGRANVKATFFVIGEKAKKHPDVVRRIVAEGHAVGLHGHAHDRFTSIRSPGRIVADLKRASKVIAPLVGHEPVLFRPPVGHTSPRVAKAVDKLGLAVVGWSVRAFDGLGKSDPARLVRRVRGGLRDGAIVQLHDAREHGDDEPASVAALPAILEALRDRGLEAVLVTTWVDAWLEKRLGRDASRP